MDWAVSELHTDDRKTGPYNTCNPPHTHTHTHTHTLSPSLPPPSAPFHLTSVEARVQTQRLLVRDLRHSRQLPEALSVVGGAKTHVPVLLYQRFAERLSGVSRSVQTQISVW